MKAIGLVILASLFFRFRGEFTKNTRTYVLPSLEI